MDKSMKRSAREAIEEEDDGGGEWAMVESKKSRRGSKGSQSECQEEEGGRDALPRPRAASMVTRRRHVQDKKAGRSIRHGKAGEVASRDGSKAGNGMVEVVVLLDDEEEEVVKAGASKDRKSAAEAAVKQMAPQEELSEELSEGGMSIAEAQVVEEERSGNDVADDLALGGGELAGAGMAVPGGICDEAERDQEEQEAGDAGDESEGGEASDGGCPSLVSFSSSAQSGNTTESDGSVGEPEGDLEEQDEAGEEAAGDGGSVEEHAEEMAEDDGGGEEDEEGSGDGGAKEHAEEMAEDDGGGEDDEEGSEDGGGSSAAAEMVEASTEEEKALDDVKMGMYRAMWCGAGAMKRACEKAKAFKELESWVVVYEGAIREEIIESGYIGGVTERRVNAMRMGLAMAKSIKAREVAIQAAGNFVDLREDVKSAKEVLKRIVSEKKKAAGAEGSRLLREQEENDALEEKERELAAEASVEIEALMKQAKESRQKSKRKAGDDGGEASGSIKEALAEGVLGMSVASGWKESTIKEWKKLVQYVEAGEFDWLPEQKDNERRKSKFSGVELNCMIGMWYGYIRKVNGKWEIVSTPGMRDWVKKGLRIDKKKTKLMSHSRQSDQRLDVFGCSIIALLAGIKVVVKSGEKAEAGPKNKKCRTGQEGGGRDPGLLPQLHSRGILRSEESTPGAGVRRVVKIWASREKLELCFSGKSIEHAEMLSQVQACMLIGQGSETSCAINMIKQGLKPMGIYLGDMKEDRPVFEAFLEDVCFKEGLEVLEMVQELKANVLKDIQESGDRILLHNGSVLQGSAIGGVEKRVGSLVSLDRGEVVNDFALVPALCKRFGVSCVMLQCNRTGVGMFEMHLAEGRSDEVVIAVSVGKAVGFAVEKVANIRKQTIASGWFSDECVDGDADGEESLGAAQVGQGKSDKRQGQGGHGEASGMGGAAGSAGSGGMQAGISTNECGQVGDIYAESRRSLLGSDSLRRWGEQHSTPGSAHHGERQVLSRVQALRSGDSRRSGSEFEGSRATPVGGGSAVAAEAERRTRERDGAVRSREVDDRVRARAAEMRMSESGARNAVMASWNEGDGASKGGKGSKGEEYGKGGMKGGGAKGGGAKGGRGRGLGGTGSVGKGGDEGGVFGKGGVGEAGKGKGGLSGGAKGGQQQARGKAGYNSWSDARSSSGRFNVQHLQRARDNGREGGMAGGRESESPPGRMKVTVVDQVWDYWYDSVLWGKMMVFFDALPKKMYAHEWNRQQMFMAMVKVSHEQKSKNGGHSVHEQQAAMFPAGEWDAVVGGEYLLVCGHTTTDEGTLVAMTTKDGSTKGRGGNKQQITSVVDLDGEHDYDLEALGGRSNGEAKPVYGHIQKAFHFLMQGMALEAGNGIVDYGRDQFGRLRRAAEAALYGPAVAWIFEEVNPDADFCRHVLVPVIKCYVEECMRRQQLENPEVFNSVDGVCVVEVDAKRGIVSRVAAECEDDMQAPWVKDKVWFKNYSRLVYLRQIENDAGGQKQFVQVGEPAVQASSMGAVESQRAYVFLHAWVPFIGGVDRMMEAAQELGAMMLGGVFLMHVSVPDFPLAGMTLVRKVEMDGGNVFVTGNSKEVCEGWSKMLIFIKTELCAVGNGVPGGAGGGMHDREAGGDEGSGEGGASEYSFEGGERVREEHEMRGGVSRSFGAARGEGGHSGRQCAGEMSVVAVEEHAEHGEQGNEGVIRFDAGLFCEHGDVRDDVDVGCSSEGAVGVVSEEGNVGAVEHLRWMATGFASDLQAAVEEGLLGRKSVLLEEWHAMADEIAGTGLRYEERECHEGCGGVALCGRRGGTVWCEHYEGDEVEMEVVVAVQEWPGIREDSSDDDSSDDSSGEDSSQVSETEWDHSCVKVSQIHQQRVEHLQQVHRAGVELAQIFQLPAGSVNGVGTRGDGAGVATGASVSEENFVTPVKGMEGLSRLSPLLFGGDTGGKPSGSSVRSGESTGVEMMRACSLKSCEGFVTDEAFSSNARIKQAGQLPMWNIKFEWCCVQKGEKFQVPVCMLEQYGGAVWSVNAVFEEQNLLPAAFRKQVAFLGVGTGRFQECRTLARHMVDTMSSWITRCESAGGCTMLIMSPAMALLQFEEQFEDVKDVLSEESVVACVFNDENMEGAVQMCKRELREGARGDRAFAQMKFDSG